MRTERDVNETIALYSDTVQRICLCHLKNYADMEDMFQTIFMKYMMYDGTFESENHKKAWILRVSSNACKDYLRTNFWRRNDSFETLLDQFSYDMEDEHREVLEAVYSLPDKYKNVIYLHYYEGYRAAEIADIIGKKENTVYSLLSRGRDLLKKKLGGDWDE